MSRGEFQNFIKTEVLPDLIGHGVFVHIDGIVIATHSKGKCISLHHEGVQRFARRQVPVSEKETTPPAKVTQLITFALRPPQPSAKLQID